MAGTSKPKKRSARRRDVGLSSADFERLLLDNAATIAPADVTSLLARADSLRERLLDERTSHPLMGQRARIGLRMLSDHARGDCPQIPYSTISLLAAALYYYSDPMDVIPDFIPGIGTADDAIMFELAWRLGGAGIERYLEWKGLVAPQLPTAGRVAGAKASRSTPAARATAATKTAGVRKTAGAGKPAGRTPAGKPKPRR